MRYHSGVEGKRKEHSDAEDPMRNMKMCGVLKFVNAESLYL